MNQEENIKVVIRFRPSKDESKIKSFTIDTEKNRITDKENRNYLYDFIFDEKTSQDTIFEKSSKEVVERVCDGYNSTIFAYGATGCLHPDTELFLYSGEKKMVKDLTCEDILLGDDSKPRKILEFFSGKDDMYEITTENRESYIVNSTHILTLKSDAYPFGLVDIELKQFLSYNETFRSTFRGVYSACEYFQGKTYEERFRLLQDNIKKSESINNRFYPNSKKHSEEVYELCRSLGYPCVWEGENCLIIPKKYNWKNYHNINIKYHGYGDYMGFRLDGNGRFLLKDFIVTHNSGKTFTMFGKDQDKGVIPRSCKLVFDIINSKENVIGATLKCSFLEIYSEHIRDLLVNKDVLLKETKEGNKETKEGNKETKEGNKEMNKVMNSIDKPLGVEPLRIRNEGNGNVYVQGLIEKCVYSPEEIEEIVNMGIKNRVVGSTSLNDVSSRSHAVLSLFLTQNLSDGTEITSKLHMIDLAGSENVGKSEVQGIMLSEAQTINKSLSCLGNVIYALSEKGRTHIPYRDSRLTYLLQDSLGGNSKTVLIATLSKNISSYSESLNTLKFAQRVKEIKNVPKINKIESVTVLLQRIEELNKLVTNLEKKNCEYEEIIKKIEDVGKDREDREDGKDEKKGKQKLSEYSEVELSKKNEYIDQLEKENIIQKGRNEQLERRIAEIEEEKIKEKELNKKLKEVGNKQRILSHNLSKQLYKEQIINHSLSLDLDQYKLIYSSLYEVADNPHVLSKMIKKADIKRPLINLDTFVNDITLPEIDSP